MKPNENLPAVPHPEPSPTSTPPFSEGQTLAGVYVLRRQLAAGDYAAVWLAQDEVLGKEVSLHFLPAAVRSDSRAMGELRQEVKRNRQLIHPNILRVHDLIEESDWAAIAMDAFEGETVASLLAKKEGRCFEPGEVREWLGQLCQTLDDAHKIQIVHRNVSPANLVLPSSGKLLMTNFGISRVMEDARGRSKAPDAKAPRHLAYTSPQQLDGESPNRADDLYAVGAVLHELLTGEPVFATGDLVSQIRKSVPQPMMERRAKLGKGGGTILPTWEKAVAACLAKDPAERPASAMELAGKLGLGKSAGDKAPAEPATAAPALVAGAAIAASAAPKTEATVSETKKMLPVIVERDRTKSAAPAVEKGAAKLGSPSLPEKKRARDAEKKAAKEEAVDLDAQGVPDIYPSLYPQRSRFPLTGVAVAVVLAGVGLSAFYFTHQAQNTESASLGEPSTRAADSGELALVNNSNPLPRNPEIAIAPKQSETEMPHAPAAVKSPGVNAAASSAEAQRTASASSETSAPARSGIASAAPKSEILLAATRTPKRGSTPAPATPAPGVAVPAATPASAPLPSNSGVGDMGADPNLAQIRAELEKARQAADAADKAAQDTRKQQQQADAALAEAQKAIDEKTKAAGPISKAAEELETQRKQRDEEQKAADLAAQQARQVADDKARQAEAAKKAVADWDTQNKGKLAAKQKADAEIQSLQTALVEKQRVATEIARLAKEADGARQQRITALRQVEGEAEQARVASEARRTAEAEARRVAEARAQQRAQIEKEISDMKRQFEEKLKALDDLKNSVSGAPAPAARPIDTTRPAPSASTSVPPPASAPAPVPSAVAAADPSPALPADPVPPAAPAPTTLAMSTPPKAPILTPPDDATPPAPTASAAVATENSLGMKFISVPAIDPQFAIWPTRLKDFELFAKETNLKSTTWRAPGFKQGPDHPVVNVTWNEAVSFCRWLTDRERKSGALSKEQGYRLPTDLEWSKAVGLPEETGKTPEARDMSVPDVFPWGTQWPPPTNVGNYTGEETGSDVAIKGYDDGFAWTSPVGSFPPNQYGLHDMGGNVWQWCMDGWNGESKAKVLRGASWYNGALKLSLLSSCRVNANPDSSTDNYGFRVVRVMEAGKSARR